MGETLRFFKEYEVFIYIILGVLAVWQLRKFTQAWNELRAAAFGLEREIAQAHLNRAAGWIVMLLLLAVAEFSVVSFVIPAVPEALPLFTPTVDLLATPTITLLPGTEEPTPEGTQTPVAFLESQVNGCVPGSVEIISPKDGDSVSDVVDIIGTVDVPNFGFYKFEVAAVGDLSWLTIQAGETITREGKLGFWDTRAFNQGEYFLQLVVTDNQGTPLPPCVVRVNVIPGESP